MRSATWRRKGGLVAMGACEAEKLVMKGLRGRAFLAPAQEIYMLHARP